MNRLDWTNLGGMRFTQNRMKFLQDSNLWAFSSLAKLCGEKVILWGIEVNAGNVSDGCFAYQGELIEFVGGAVGAKVKINEVDQPFTYADNTVHNVQIIRTASCGPIGDFDFSELVPLLSLQNTWKKDDVRMAYKDNVYIAANFENDGTGINAEKGWRILAKAITNTAGRVFVNWDGNVTDYNAVGKIGGSQTYTLAQNNLPASVLWRVPLVQHTASGAGFGVTDGPSGGPGFTDISLLNVGGGQPFDKRPPYFVMLHLIKL